MISDSELQPGQRLGVYRIIRQLGAGGMGTVYQAEHERIARPVAIKVLRPELTGNAEAAARFLNEARAVNVVAHPGVVEISDYGQLPDGTAYIVMELLAGEPLSALLGRSGGHLAEAQVLPIAVQLAVTLAAAHAKKIIHRDLKPENIMLVPDPGMLGGLKVKVLDFGIAKVAQELQRPQDLVQTRAGAMLGTPAYMSPEQCRGAEQVDERSDVYSFGALLYRLLAGRPPFVGTAAGEVMAMHIMQTPPPLRVLAPTVSPPLDQLIGRMLAKHAHERPTMVQVAQELGQRLPRVATTPAFVRPALIAVALLTIGGGLWWSLRADPRAGAPEVGPRVRAPASTTAAANAGCTQSGFCPQTLADAGRLRAVWGTSTESLWLAGDHGSLLRLAKGKVLPAQSGTEAKLSCLRGFADNDIWGVGDRGIVLHYDGTSWQKAPGISEGKFSSIWGPSSQDLWVAGKSGALFHFDGAAWSAVPSGSQENLHRGISFSSRDVWVVGTQGTALHYAGRSFRRVTTGTDNKLAAIWGSSPTAVWAVGSGGTVLRYDGKKFSPIESHTTQDLKSVWGSGPDDVWFVGGAGTIGHFDGHRVTLQDSGVQTDLYDVFGDRAAVVAVGDSGAVTIAQR